MEYLRENENSVPILELNHEEAREHFLKQEIFCNCPLPKYLEFGEVLSFINEKLQGIEGKRFKDYIRQDTVLQNQTNMNYHLVINKDGKHATRLLQFIHPVLYVNLVQIITSEYTWQSIKEQFKLFQENQKIECKSIPRKSLTKEKHSAEQILFWWNEVEQKSVELALDYKCLLLTDLTDCYGSIRTKLLLQALNIEEDKNNQDSVSNKIREVLDYMLEGAFSGIPQGSVLMDFLAEIILGYTDLKLTKYLERYNIKNYKILRYRDDYRIFSNSNEKNQQVKKCLIEIMDELGFKLSDKKTIEADNLIKDSIKEDKLYWIKQKQTATALHKHLLIIHDLAMKFPNLGSVLVALNHFYNRLYLIYKVEETAMKIPDYHHVKDIKKFVHKNKDELEKAWEEKTKEGKKKEGKTKEEKWLPQISFNSENFFKYRLFESERIKQNIAPLVSISSDIACISPRACPYVMSIISLLLMFKKDQIFYKETYERVNKKLKSIPNKGHMEIWQQRLVAKSDVELELKDSLCELIDKKRLGEKEEIHAVELWNFSWLRDDFCEGMSPLINKDAFDNLDDFIAPDEVELFKRFQYADDSFGF